MANVLRGVLARFLPGTVPCSVPSAPALFHQVLRTYQKSELLPQCLWWVTLPNFRGGHAGSDKRSLSKVLWRVTGGRGSVSSNSEIHALPPTALRKLSMTQVPALGREKAARALLTLFGSTASQHVGTQPCAGGSRQPRGTDTPGAWPSAESVDRSPSLVIKAGHRERCGQHRGWQLDVTPLGTGSRSRGIGPCWAQSSPVTCMSPGKGGWPRRFWLGLWNSPSCPGRAHGPAASWAVALKVAGLTGRSNQD